MATPTDSRLTVADQKLFADALRSGQLPVSWMIEEILKLREKVKALEAKVP